VVKFLVSQAADTAIENGDGKTPLQLAEECNHVEIFYALKSCTSQVERHNSETESLASHNSQPVAANPNEVSAFHSNSHAAMTGNQAASNVLLPFSGKLRVDKELKLREDKLKQSIENVYGNSPLSAIDQLEKTFPYPTPHVLAQFASLAYNDHVPEHPNPLPGWKLLTKASNCGIKNGYFGIAYWHPEHQQVVIAHRGTQIESLRALVQDVYTDVQGVLRKNYVPQMSSASTFANKVVAVLQEIYQKNNVDLQLFFTGHSLGGWLSQITTFTTEYLEENGSTFLKKQQKERNEPLTRTTVPKSFDVQEVCHPHTVAFESPGCKNTLSQMVDELDVRYEGCSTDLLHLDINSYLSAPNLINTCNKHLGTVYRIFTDLIHMGFLGQHTPLYNIATHRLDKIVEAFDPAIGEPKILLVADWPVSAGLSKGQELNDFFQWAEKCNNYHTDVTATDQIKTINGYHLLRYQTTAYDECTESLRVFTKDEREFLQGFTSLRNMQKFLKPTHNCSVMNNTGAEEEPEKKVPYFQLDKDRIRCADASTLHKLIPYVKRMVRLFPHTKAKYVQPKNIYKTYQIETMRYVTKINQSTLNFKPGTLALKEFLDSGQQIWLLRMIDGDVWTGITKVYWVLQNTSCMHNYSSAGQYTILKLGKMLMDNGKINLNALLTSIHTPHLLMIACGNNQPDNDELKNVFQELFSILKEKNTVKIILTTQSEDDTFDTLQKIAIKTLGNGLKTTDEKLTWSDITFTEKKLEKTVIFQGTRVALNQLIST
jgi:hypothetical protein